MSSNLLLASVLRLKSDSSVVSPLPNCLNERLANLIVDSWLNYPLAEVLAYLAKYSILGKYSIEIPFRQNENWCHHLWNGGKAKTWQINDVKKCKPCRSNEKKWQAPHDTIWDNHAHLICPKKSVCLIFSSSKHIQNRWSQRWNIRLHIKHLMRQKECDVQSSAKQNAISWSHRYKITNRKLLKTWTKLSMVSKEA